MLFESEAALLDVISGSFTGQQAQAVAALVKPAVAVVRSEGHTSSWVRGPALLPEGMPWPTVDGRQLMHTARIDLASVPLVSADQPSVGHLSFFDGYPWANELGWTGPDVERLVSVVQTSDGVLVEQHCPLDAAQHEFVFHEPPTYVEFIGPCYSIPSPEVVIDHAGLSWGDESLRRFSDGLSGLVMEQHVLGQLFGNVSSIQNHPTPLPRNVRNDVPPNPEAWDHLATFADGSGVFDFYFSVLHGDLADQRFTNLAVEFQCD